MKVDGIGREGMQGNIKAQATDSVSKNLRAQIVNAQKQLQELAANKDMEPEEKMERRKEIQQQITDLNAQLRQHEVELRQEKQQQQQAKQSVQSKKQEAEKKAETAPGGKQGMGMSQGSMEAMISANRSVGQAKIQGKVASAMKARANVLKSEIEHSGRGAAVEKKQQDVADIEDQLEKIATEQAQSLN
nr:FlxA-like family protein [Lachnospiraceae bacterium]